MDWLEREFRLPLIVAGFSFGAAMALRACCLPGATHHDVRALIALGLPSHGPGPAYDYSFLQNLTTPKLFLSGDRDQFAPAEQLTQCRRFCSRTQAPHPHSRRRPFLYRSTGTHAARSCRLVEGAIAMTPVSDTALESLHATATGIFTGATQGVATSRPLSTAVCASRATFCIAFCPTAAAPQPSISPHTNACL